MNNIAYEHWVPIDGYEGWYEVSDLGRVRSVDRVVKFKNGTGSRFYKGQILKFRYHNGYAMVNLNKNKKMKEHYVHRLVIENFTLHPRKKTWVNHKNGKKWDNRLDNLEWCTPGENNEHAVRTGLRHDNLDGLFKHIDSQRKPVAWIDGEKILKEKKSAKAMSKYLIEKGVMTGETEDQVARAIRYACRSGSPHQGQYFKYI